MTGSRRFLLLLFLACISCVLLVQVSLDNWNFGPSFSYTFNPPPKDEVLHSTETTVNISTVKTNPTTATTLHFKSTATQVSKVKKVIKKLTPPNNASQHIEYRGQVRRLPLGRIPKQKNEPVYINRQERVQEILNQGRVIHGRPTVDPMKTLKSMPIINPNNVTRIILITYFRSGSSFIGDLLQQNWKTFYHFEPLHSMTYNIRIKDDKTDKAFNLFNGIFKCNFTELEDYIQWVKKPRNQFLFAHNLFLRVTCRSNPKVCFNPSFVNAVCQRAPMHVMKVTRLHMYQLKKYLHENKDLNLKVVYLTRDPRGIVSSRRTLDWCNGTECTDPGVLCHEMSEDLKIFYELKQQQPSNFVQVRYEDLSLNPEIESKKLFNILKLPFSVAVQRFLKTHTVGRRTDDNNPYSTRRNSTLMAFSWKERFTFKDVLDVQSPCKEVLKTLNHSLITSPEELPYPFGKLKSNSASSSNRNLQNSENFLMTKQKADGTVVLQISKNFKLPPQQNDIVITNMNNTNIEIHKSSARDSKNKTDYIVIKQTVY